METMLIELRNEKAIGLLQKLEELQLIRLLKEPYSAKEKLAEQYAGKLPANVAEELQKQVSKSRSEWSPKDI